MSVSQRVIRFIHIYNYYIDNFSPTLTVGNPLANTETPYTFTITFPTAIGIGNVIETEFPSEMLISSTPTITGDPCLGGTVTRDISGQIIQVETSQACNAGSFTMVITAVKNPVSIYISFTYFAIEHSGYLR